MENKKIVGIVAEFNPLHNGHEKLINEAKKISSNVIVALSGNVTQRGDFACLDKITRAKHAVLMGAQLVIEIPSIFVLSSAKFYAKGAVTVLKNVGCTDLIFGSECGDIKLLKKISTISSTNDFCDAIKKYQDKNNSYPRSFELALKDFISTDFTLSPNNILAIEYIKVANELNLNVHTIKRNGSYLDSKLASTTSPSANAIRLSSLKMDEIKDYLPKIVLDDADKINVDSSNFYPILRNTIFNYPYDINDIYDAKYGIANKIVREIKVAKTLNVLTNLVISKRYTATFLHRLFLHIALNIESSYADKLLNDKNAIYQVLAIKKDSVSYLKKPILFAKYKDYKDRNQLQNDNFLLMNKIDQLFSTVKSLPYQFSNAIII